jgi:hypothetical protein
MPKRGSVQFLLLFSRLRVVRRLGLGAAAVILLLAGLVQFRDGLPLLDKSGFAQALRQSAWESALAGQSQPARWPWEDMSANMSFVPAANVPRLGLSAELLKYTADASEPASPEPRRAAPAKTASAAQGDVALSDVAIGDSITFTAADGATCVYRVTGRRVVDPHLAEREAERIDGETSLFSCGPLDRLIMQATQDALADGEPSPAAPHVVSDQQKL